MLALIVLACRPETADRTSERHDLSNEVARSISSAPRVHLAFGGAAGQGHLLTGWARGAPEEHNGRSYAVAAEPTVSFGLQLTKVPPERAEASWWLSGNWSEASELRARLGSQPLIVGRHSSGRLELEVPTSKWSPALPDQTTRLLVRVDGVEPPTRVHALVSESSAARSADNPAEILVPADGSLDFLVHLPPCAELELQFASLDAGVETSATIWRLDEPDVPLVEADHRQLAGGSPLTWCAELPSAGLHRLRISARNGAATLGSGTSLRWAVAPRSEGTLEREPSATKDSPSEGATGHSRPNILVYLVDTLRRDHLTVYGYQRPTSPALEKFARTATLYGNAVAESSWTRPSVASLMTGLTPSRHDVHGRNASLGEEHQTLAELLQAAGYVTYGHIANPNVAQRFGFAQGFDEYRLLHRDRKEPEILGDRFLQWFDRRNKSVEPESGSESQPFFAYLHTIAPHAPYEAPQEYLELFSADPRHHAERSTMRFIRQLNRREIEVTPELIEDLRARYDAEIRWNDDAFGKLLAGLEARDLLDDTLIVFVSDHGEEFYEHGHWEHGTSLHTELIDIPLLIRFPGQSAPERHDSLVGLVDLLPTLVSAAGLTVPAHLSGRDLERPVQLGPATDALRYSRLAVDGRSQSAVTSANWRYIRRDRRVEVPLEQLFRRSADSSELDDLSTQHPTLTGLFAAQVGWHERFPPLSLARDVELDPELVEQLRAMGYLD